MAEAALLDKSVSSSSSSFYLIMTNDAKHMCQGNEMNVFVGKFKSFFFSFLRKKVWVLSERRRRRETKEEVFCIGSNNNGDSVRIQTRGSRKEKSQLSLVVFLCSHSTRRWEDEWLLVENRGC